MTPAEVRVLNDASDLINALDPAERVGWYVYLLESEDDESVLKRLNNALAERIHAGTW